MTTPLMINHSTIAAPATASGGALSIIRVSGEQALEICDRIFRSASGRKLSQQKGYTLMYGTIVDRREKVVDDVLISIFRAPRSYTGEDMAEISCHGSKYITQAILRLLTDSGARMANAGEFTTRAFLAGKMDLSQAEAVADMIASHDAATHALASTQMRGGYSADLEALRADLLRLTSLMELELDFGEEEVSFADRSELAGIIRQTISRIEQLTDSFSLGKAIKEGIGVAIVGPPNAGKSTLLNTLLHEDRAMVSDIEGTTRDLIEEHITIDGTDYRLIDTAGIRESDDRLEQMGIRRTLDAIEKAQIVLVMFDARSCTTGSIVDSLAEWELDGNKKVCIVLNKCDEGGCSELADSVAKKTGYQVIAISAKYGHNLDRLYDFLSSALDTAAVYEGQTVISNSRHYDSLRRALAALQAALSALQNNISSELISQDIRMAISALGEITAREITTDEILGEIFSKFCIGK